MRKRFLLPGLLGAAALQACAQFTYPSPRLEGMTASAAFEPADDFKDSCRQHLLAVRGSTRSFVAFRVAGPASLCFTSPVDKTAIAQQEDTTCVKGVMGLHEGYEPLVFRVFVGGKDLSLDEAAATLETKGGAATAKGELKTDVDSYIDDLPAPVDVGGARRYPVNGEMLSYAQASPYFKRPVDLLEFHFDQDCDPSAHYRLTLTGLAQNGRALAVPPVDFDPFTEDLPDNK